MGDNGVLRKSTIVANDVFNPNLFTGSLTFTENLKCIP